MNKARTQFDYLLNAFEQASQSDRPADLDYAGKRRALYAYVRDLEKRADAPPATSDPGPWPATGLEPRGCPIPGACACPPATSAELVALIEAVDTLLESAPCECPHRMREERGEHLSHCYLFDLNVARSGAGEKR